MKKEILTLFMSGCSVILAAQTTGTVVDENKQPLPAATVSLFRESENKMIGGMVTGILMVVSTSNLKTTTLSFQVLFHVRNK